jgi:hypothetical protein
MATSMPPQSPRLELEERDQAGQIVARYIASNGRVDVIVRLIELPISREHRLIRLLQEPENSKGYTKTLLSAFLPAGYPQSVTEDYLE